MGTESPTAGQVDDRVQNPGESLKSVEGDGVPEAKGEISKEKDANWPFINSQPIREEQVQNAVKFLSHPKVRGSPVIYRRSFLEKKGLSKDEIDEAFRRVPDPPSHESGAKTAVPSQETQSPTPVLPHVQSAVQTLQHSAPLPVTAPPLPVVQPSGFHWTQMFLAVGLLTAAGAGTGVLFKNTFVPRLKAWIRQVISEVDDSEAKNPLQPSLAEEATGAAKAAAMAAADVANATRELLKSKTEERKYFEGLVRTVEGQMEEIKSLKIALKNMENARHDFPIPNGQLDYQVGNEARRGKSNGTWRTISSIEQEDPRGVSQMISKNLKEDGDVAIVEQGSVRPSSAPATVEPGRAPHSQSYMEVLAMVERGEKPPGIQEVNDKPPNPNQPPSNPRLQPRLKPWEASQVQNSSASHSTHTQYFKTGSSSSLNQGTRLGSVHEVQGNGSANMQANSIPSAAVIAANNSEPWWRHKTNEMEFKRVTSLPPENTVRITEMVSGDEETSGSMRPELPNGGSSGSNTYGPSDSALHGLSSRAWTPPPPPPLSMPDAAVAIWNSKVTTRKEELITATGMSSSSTLEQGPADEQFVLPGSLIQQEESHAPSSSEPLNVTENSEEQGNGFHAFSEESSHEKSSYKEVVKEGVEVIEDVHAF